MQIDASKNQSFYMDLTTKSGKHLSLSMYDNQSVNYAKNDDGQALSLRREYGFRFEYQGSQLTQQDLSEIDAAMKDITPSLNEFLANSKVGELKPRDFIENALKIANVLPTPRDENHQNAIMDKLTTNLEGLLNKNKSPVQSENVSMLEDSKKLIEEIFKQMQENLKKAQEKAEQNSQNANEPSSNAVNLYV